MNNINYQLLLLLLFVVGCSSGNKEYAIEEESQSDYLFIESTGKENIWLIDEAEINASIITDERLQKVKAVWNERNESLGLISNELNLNVFSLIDAGKIIKKLSLQQNDFVIPLPLDNGFADFEFSEFEGFSSANSKFFVGKNLQDKSLEATIFIGGNTIDISISSSNDVMLLSGVPLSSSLDDKYDFIVMSTRKSNARRRLSESGLENASGKKIKRKVSQEPRLKHRRLRIAVAATAEYTAFHGPEDTPSQIESTIASTSKILFRELGIRVKLIFDQNLIFNNPDTDPFDNDNIDSLLVQNQALLDSVIEDSNYDIGHVFSTNRDGGLAYRGGAGISGKKARGATGGRFPYGDPFIVDYVTHEIGHQLGANHTFTSASCGLIHRNDSTSTEPGSGSSIMSYASLCSGDNLQFNAGKYFHTISYDEIMSHLNTINLETFQSANTPPTVVVVKVPFPIPKETPFILSANGFDNESDIIHYSWDQIDIDLSPVDLGDQTEYSPLFRSYKGSKDTFRIFPSLPLLLDHFLIKGELLPNMARELNFSCVAKDLRGGINYQDIKLIVTDVAGPFAVLTPNTFVAFNKNAKNTMEWDPANTNIHPVNCDSVDIFLTLDRCKNLVPLGRFKNSGSADVFIGDYTSTKARIWIQASNNVFFDISDNDFEIK